MLRGIAHPVSRRLGDERGRSAASGQRLELAREADSPPDRDARQTLAAPDGSQEDRSAGDPDVDAGEIVPDRSPAGSPRAFSLGRNANWARKTRPMTTLVTMNPA